MKIDGRNLSEHPMANRDDPDLRPRSYRNDREDILAARATDFGQVEGDRDVMQFAPGDYIVTDDPPTHAWVVPQSVFESIFVVE